MYKSTIAIRNIGIIPRKLTVLIMYWGWWQFQAPRESADCRPKLDITKHKHINIIIHRASFLGKPTLPTMEYFFLPKSAVVSKDSSENSNSFNTFYLSDLGLHTRWLWLWVACCTLLCTVEEPGRVYIDLCIVVEFGRAWTGADLCEVVLGRLWGLLFWKSFWNCNGEFATLGTDG